MKMWFVRLGLIKFKIRQNFGEYFFLFFPLNFRIIVIVIVINDIVDKWNEMIF